VLGEDPLRLCLGDEQDERIARVHRADVAKPRRRNPAAFEVDDQSRARVPARHERVAEPEAVEDLEGPGLHGERARFARAVERAIDDPDVRS
jgi:stress response protein YsnF